MSDDAVLQLSKLQRFYRQGERRLHVLNGVDLTVAAGEVVALIGPSGSGKSTLLHTAGLLEAGDGGDVLLAGQACQALSDHQRTRLRRYHIGFVYQFHHLLPEFSALENVVVPQRIAGCSRREAAKRAETLLGQLGLQDRLQHRPAQLSGGEQQRVAIARALANQPRLILADEPTGNLDQVTADSVFEALMQAVRQDNLAALIATHNADLAQRMDRIVRLSDGQLQTL